jgi:hypothetical protein
MVHIHNSSDHLSFRFKQVDSQLPGCDNQRAKWFPKSSRARPPVMSEFVLPWESHSRAWAARGVRPSLACGPFSVTHPGVGLDAIGQMSHMNGEEHSRNLPMPAYEFEEIVSELVSTEFLRQPAGKQPAVGLCNV